MMHSALERWVDMGTERMLFDVTPHRTTEALVYGMVHVACGLHVGPLALRRNARLGFTINRLRGKQYIHYPSANSAFFNCLL